MVKPSVYNNREQSVPSARLPSLIIMSQRLSTPSLNRLGFSCPFSFICIEVTRRGLGSVRDRPGPFSRAAWVGLLPYYGTPFTS